MPTIAQVSSLRRSDHLLLTLFCAVLFGFPLIGDRPLTMHEAVLPENAREMLADHDWLIPKYGGFPWLERPPLPHWITVAIGCLAGGCDREWVVRLPVWLMGIVGTLLTAGFAARTFGRGVGILSGGILATMSEYFRYAYLAESDMFLFALVTAALVVFAHHELASQAVATEDGRFLGRRPRGVLLFFILLGMTNLAKGLIFGNLMVLVPVVLYLAGNAAHAACDSTALPGAAWADLRRYCWLWGWLAFAVIALAWPFLVLTRYPEAIDLWKSDYLGRLNGGYMGEPWWYYLAQLAPVLRPWLLPGLAGLALTVPTVFRPAGRRERFLWCWAIGIPLFFSIPHGKHHHYLLPCLTPWAVLAALGLVSLWQRLPAWPTWMQNPIVHVVGLGLPVIALLIQLTPKLTGPSWLPYLLAAVVLAGLGALCWQVYRRHERATVGTLLALTAVGQCFIYSYAFHCFDRHRDDTRFLRAARALIPTDEPVYVKRCEVHVLDSFRLLFYLGRGSTLLPNLSYLLDDAIVVRDIYVVAHDGDAAWLGELGRCEMLLCSKHSLHEADSHGRWALFRLHYRDDLVRQPAPPLSAMQATGRAPLLWLREASPPASHAAPLFLSEAQR